MVVGLDVAAQVMDVAAQVMGVAAGVTAQLKLLLAAPASLAAQP